MTENKSKMMFTVNILKYSKISLRKEALARGGIPNKDYLTIMYMVR